MTKRPEPGNEIKLRGRFYVCMSLTEVAEGDYAELPGRRMRKVSAVVHHRSGECTVSLEPLVSGKFTLDCAQRVSLHEVLAVWRRRSDGSPSRP